MREERLCEIKLENDVYIQIWEYDDKYIHSFDLLFIITSITYPNKERTFNFDSLNDLFSFLRIISNINISKIEKMLLLK